MKIPDLKDFTLNPVPREYGLKLSDIEEIDRLINEASEGDRWKLISGLYSWGFTRGASYQQKRQKAAK